MRNFSAGNYVTATCCHFFLHCLYHNKLRKILLYIAKSIEGNTVSPTANIIFKTFLLGNSELKATKNYQRSKMQ